MAEQNNFLINRFFNDLEITVLGSNEKPYFYAYEIGIILGIVKVRNSVANFTDDERVSLKVREEQGIVTYRRHGKGMCVDTKTILLTEKGVYTLIFNSMSPVARQFQSFVFDLLADIRRKEIEQLIISHNATVEQLTKTHLALLAKYDEMNEHAPIIYVFEREISGNPYKYIPKEDVDLGMEPYQEDAEVLYKCTVKPTALDYKKYVLVAKIYGTFETVWGSMEGEELSLERGETFQHTRYFVDDEPEFAEGKRIIMRKKVAA